MSVMNSRVSLQQISFIRQILKKIPIFSRLTTDEHHTLSLQMEFVVFKKGTKIIREHQKLKWFGIIWKGAVAVSGSNHLLITGDCIGEEALVDQQEPKSEHTMKCVQNTEILIISEAAFSTLFGKRLSYNWRRSATNGLLSEELMELSISSDHNDDSESVHLPKQRRGAKAETFTATSASQQLSRAKSSNLKTTKLRMWIKNELKQNILFKNLGDTVLDAIIENVYRLKVAAGETIIKQGDMGHVLYIVESGKIHVFIDDNYDTPVATMKRGSCVGELSLMFDSPRAATCITKTVCTLWCMDRNDFKITLRREAKRELQTMADFLKTVPVLKLLTDNERHKIAACLNVITVKKNSVIIREGDKCDNEVKSKFYILKRGRAVALKQMNGRTVKVADYSNNGYFGERALILSEERAATIQTMTDCELYTLSRSEFLQTLSSLKLVIQNRMVSYEKALQMLSQRKPKFSKQKSATNKRMAFERSAKDYKYIHGLGQGSFATVWLVRDRINKQTFALKRMSKRGIEQSQQQTHVSNERATLASIDCLFIIKLFCTFQDDSNVYMVLDLGIGGDMFTYLESQTRLSEEKALFFMGCVVLAFEYLHLKSIVYRDLKPENLVFDFRGYLKLTDFGFAKRLSRPQGSEYTYTVCGTPVYLAPEVIIGKGHGLAVDWWCAGIFLYEMVTGYPPFNEDNLVQTYDAILHRHISVTLRAKKRHLKSKYICDLLQGLLRKNPNKRYGYSVIDINDRIKRHKWFKHLDWDKLAKGEIPSPYRPRLKNDCDTKYFDQDIERRRNEFVGKPREPNAQWMKGF